MKTKNFFLTSWQNSMLNTESKKSLQHQNSVVRATFKLETIEKYLTTTWIVPKTEDEFLAQFIAYLHELVKRQTKGYVSMSDKMVRVILSSSISNQVIYFVNQKIVGYHFDGNSK